METRQTRPEAFEISRITRRVDRRIRAAVERALETDHIDALGIAVRRVVLARRLQRAFDRFGARVGEEHDVSEAVARVLRGELFLARDLEHVRRVPELARLLGQRFHQNRGCVAQSVHRDAGDAVEIFVALIVPDPAAFAAHKVLLRRTIDREDVAFCGGHLGALWKKKGAVLSRAACQVKRRV